MNEGTRSPRVSIGLPVYNGDKYLEQSLDSILNQTYADFELIICDNASTDRTQEICLKHAGRDERIRYFRNAENIGGANNANLTFQHARGEYFRWASHDDVFAPELIEKCVEALDANPEILLCYTAVVQIDESGERRKVVVQPEVGRTPFDRFRFLSARHTHTCEPIYGLIRTEVLRKTQLVLNYTDSDRVLLCELGFHGPFKQIPEQLFYKRIHPGNQYKDWRGRMAWFSPELAQTGRITLPNWIQFHNYLQTLQRAPLGLRERALCYLWLFGPWLFVVGRGKSMVKDLLVAGYMLTKSKEWRKKQYGDADNWA